MAFTNFGTGLAAVAQGMAYTPNWGQEQQAMIQMGQTIQQYYAQKQQLAKENYEITQTVLPDNEADANEYNVFAKQRLIDMETYRKNNPTYLTDPNKYAEYRRMGKELQDNAITRRATSFKAQKELYAKHLAEDKGFAHTKHAEEDKAKIDYRAKYGQAAYQKYYGEEDYQFTAPNPVNLAEEVKKITIPMFAKKSEIRKDKGFASIWTGLKMTDAEKQLKIQEAAGIVKSTFPDALQDLNANRNEGRKATDQETIDQTAMSVSYTHLTLPTKRIV